jgi:hypothetical protein
MQHGIYRVLFKGLLGEGRGILVAKDGALWGGDSGFVYNGNYAEDGANQGKASVQIGRDDPKASGLFGDLQDFQVRLAWSLTPSGFSATGEIAGHPNLKIEINATKLADI